MSQLLRDFWFAPRTFRRAPGFTLAALATLSRGIGATTAIFSTVNAALLRPLPYPGWRDLYSVRTWFLDGSLTSGCSRRSSSCARSVQKPNRSYDQASAVRQRSISLVAQATEDPPLVALIPCPLLPHRLGFVLVAIAGWMNQQQRDVIDYLQEENRVLREQLGPDVCGSPTRSAVGWPPRPKASDAVFSGRSRRL
jgi:hypothetical protein